MSMSTSTILTRAMLAFLATLSITSAAGAMSSVQAMRIEHAELLTGGVGEQERAELLEMAPHYDLFVSFALRSDKTYVSGVRIEIEGRTLQHPIELTTNGPLLLANLPAGHYTLSAELAGWPPRIRHLDISRGEHQSLWVTFVRAREGD